MKHKELLLKAKEVLTTDEFKIFEQLNAQYLVPFLMGAPGLGKTAKLESIAKKLGMIYLDMRLPTKDETDLGVYPVINKTDYKDGSKTITINKLTYAIPDWATDTWDNPNTNYLIVFEELNRAAPAIRNAAMGIILERRVGHNFQFRDNVFIAATGNLGDKDGTEVEQLDFAQKDRFIIHHVKPDLMAWINDYAKDNVHPDIIKYLDGHPAKFYPDLKEQDDDAVITPRKWSGFSNFIVSNTENGLKSTIDDYIDVVDRSGSNYIGKEFVQFRKFVMEGRMLTVQEVLAGNRKTDYPKIPRDNKAEVLRELKGTTLSKITTKQATNLKDFLLHMKESDYDMLVGVVFDLFNLLEQDESCKEKDKSACLKVPVLKMLWEDFRESIDFVYNNNKHQKVEAK